jgi:hypothetical protein
MIHRVNKRGVVHPLDSKETIHVDANGRALVKYFLKVVPTAYQIGKKPVEASYEFAVTHHSKVYDNQFFGASAGVFFVYDFHPIKIVHKFQRMPFVHFLVKVSGLIGGLFVVTGMMDAIIGSLLVVKRKIIPTPPPDNI